MNIEFTKQHDSPTSTEIINVLATHFNVHPIQIVKLLKDLELINYSKNICENCPF